MTDEERELIRSAQAEYMRNWRAENPERYRAYQKLWRQNNPDRVKELNDRVWLRKARENAG